MNMLSNVLDLNDKMTKMTLLLGSAALVVLMVKNNEKALTPKVSNSVLLMVCVGTLFLAYQINEEDESSNVNLVNEVDNSSISDLSNDNVSEGFMDAPETPVSEVSVKEVPVVVEEPEVPVVEREAVRPEGQVEEPNTVAPTDAYSTKQADVMGVSPDDSSFAPISMDSSLEKVPEQCFPKDIRDPSELLPKDKDSAWAKNVPAGQGELSSQNFLNAGHHLGVNTVGQSLRNANRQLRSEPSNPQVKVSPWLQSTIEPDINRRGLDIGTN
jgi:hypothetical protein